MRKINQTTYSKIAEQPNHNDYNADKTNMITKTNTEEHIQTHGDNKKQNKAIGQPF